MDNLIRPVGLFYIKVKDIKVHEKTERKSRSQVFVNSPGRFMINNKDWKLKTVLSQIRFTEWLRIWELKIRKLAASSKTSSKLLNILGIVTLKA